MEDLKDRHHYDYLDYGNDGYEMPVSPPNFSRNPLVTIPPAGAPLTSNPPAPTALKPGDTCNNKTRILMVTFTLLGVSLVMSIISLSLTVILQKGQVQDLIARLEQLEAQSDQKVLGDPNVTDSQLEFRLKEQVVKLNQLETQVNTVLQKLQEFELYYNGTEDEPQSQSSTMGAVYTRWGRNVCGENSTLIYTGFTGGSYFNHMAGGGNYQCMSSTPEFDDRVSTGFYGAFVSGTEYQSYDHGIFPNSAYDQNVPCARCYTNNRPAVMMIPGMRNCPSAWTKEYEGYLMSGGDADNATHATTYECVDAYPEYIIGESVNNDGARLHFNRPRCDVGAQCPPYKTDEEITCVVCSR